MRSIVSPTPKRQLGKNGPLVDRVGYGTMSLSVTYGELMPDEQRLSVLDRAHKRGQMFWDTSGFYGDAEDVLGEWFAKPGKRSDIFLATNFGGILTGDPLAGGYSFRGDAEYVYEACDKRPRRWQYSPFSTGIEDPKIGLLSGRIQDPEDFGPGDIRSATTKIDRLEENFNAASVELTPAEVTRIRLLVDNASHGARWTPQHAFALFADTPTREGNIQLGAKDEKGI
ncbi:hypothetical protein DL766_002006 [Monosporascus sp. MC13-8B]|nr:hypothetical protein DL763_003859 [Monosporascus cannonballus]RYP36344.1 hypothetical protein DL766_002006 [Monosporascus sp. MC13-8B]